ncbi:MAG: lipopolysaccharide biosynthesis protein, partial [Gemmatimonadaceae bacterium]
MAWTGGVKWVGQLLSWGSTIVVARILTPEDYGLVGLATLYMALVTMLSEFGIGTTVVTLRDLTREQISQINALAIAFGLSGFLLSCVMAVPLARFFASPELALVVIAMSLTFVITSFRTVPQALLQRDLRFKRLALLDGMQTMLLAVSMVAFALLGLRYWTLVLGALLSAAISTAFIVASRPHSFARPRSATLGHAITFSRQIIFSRLSWYVYSNADFFVAGKVLGKAALGAYTFAWTVAGAPAEKVTGMVIRVTPSIFAAVQSDLAALRRYFLKLTEGLALLTFPAAFGLALVADKLVLLALGEKWSAMIIPLQLLAFYTSVRSVSPLLHQILAVTGGNRFAMWSNIAAAVVLPPAFYVGSRWGTPGIAATWLVAHPLVLLPVYRRVFSRIELAPGAYLRALWPAVSASALMAAAVIGLDRAAPADW